MGPLRRVLQVASPRGDGGQIGAVPFGQPLLLVRMSVDERLELGSGVPCLPSLQVLSQHPPDVSREASVRRLDGFD